MAIDRILDELKVQRENGFISRKSFIGANEIASKRAKASLDKDKPAISDGNFYHKSQIKDLINKLNYPHYVFTLKTPLAVCINRDSKRSKKHGSDAAKAVYKKSTEFEYGIAIIDAARSPTEIIRQITSNLPMNRITR